MNKRKRSISESSGDHPRSKRGSQADDVDNDQDDFQTQDDIGDDFDADAYFEKHGWCLDAGVIEHVKMTNFMCHAKFDYYPTQRINFITGVNGSGKSAVMSALIFGLGGTAKMTQRGKSNKSFIRTDQAQANVEISLFNVGENAYRPVSYA